MPAGGARAAARGDPACSRVFNISSSCQRPNVGARYPVGPLMCRWIGSLPHMRLTLTAIAAVARGVDHSMCHPLLVTAPVLESVGCVAFEDQLLEHADSLPSSHPVCSIVTCDTALMWNSCERDRPAKTAAPAGDQRRAAGQQTRPEDRRVGRDLRERHQGLLNLMLDGRELL